MAESNEDPQPSAPIVGGGDQEKKRIFILLRYTFIVAAGYLILFGSRQAVGSAFPLIIVAALLSNLLLSCLPAYHLFALYLQLPVVVVDTLWISYGLAGSGVAGQEFFLLYFFVLTLAAIGENLATVLIGAVLVGVASLYSSSAPGGLWSSPALVRIPFFFTVALFYGHSAMVARQERLRAARGLAAAHQLEGLVEERTRALALKTEQLEASYVQAKAAHRLKSEFLATLSHEFLTPLHVVLGYIELLLEAREQRLDDNARRLVERIQQNASRLVDMVHGILDFARLESGTVRMCKARVDFAALARDLVSPERLRCPASVEARCELEEALPGLVTDGEKLRSLLANLLSNAVKFTQHGEVVLSIRRDDPDRVLFEVRDSGIGIRQEDVTAIFDDFRQLDGSARRRHEGVGLGLALVRRYADLLGGTLCVESRVGHGSCFGFSLPVSNAAAPAGEPDNPPQLAIAS